MTDPDAPTPKITGSIHRWPIFRDMANRIVTATGHAALRSEKVLHEIDLARARRLRETLREATALRDTFAAWEFGDPGADLRHQAIQKLYDMREHVRAMGIDVDAIGG